MKCIFCDNEIEGNGNDPQPFIGGTPTETARCCDMCEAYIAPMRDLVIQSHVDVGYITSLIKHGLEYLKKRKKAASTYNMHQTTECCFCGDKIEDGETTLIHSSTTKLEPKTYAVATYATLTFCPSAKPFGYVK